MNRVVTEAPQVHRRNFAWRIVSAIATLVLLSAVVFQWTNLRDVDHGSRVETRSLGVLKSRLPSSIPTWTSRALPIGPTEISEHAAREILNFDDVFYRSYDQHGRQFAVYVAYWAPGRMPVSRVAEHTPDICWIAAGWKLIDARHAERIRVDGTVLAPGEWRLMRYVSRSSQYVVFWHLVGGRTYVQGLVFHAIPSPIAFFRNAIRYAFGKPEQQYFIRLSSSVPFDELAGDPGFQQMVAALAKLGLAEGGT